LKAPLPAWTSGIRYDGTHMQATGAYFGYQVDVPLRRPRVEVPHGDEEDGARSMSVGTEPPRSSRREIIPAGVPISDQYQVLEFFQQGYNSGLTALLRFSSWITDRLQ